jgi:signal peptidase
MTSRRIARAVGRGALFAIRAAIVLGLSIWLLLFRPAQLAGSTSYVFIGGESMLPGYQVGDLIVAQPAAHYGPGDVIVYRIPEGDPGAGRLVIHRITGGDETTGFTTRGDHNGYTDRWHPRRADILGSPMALLPGAGKVVQVLRQPLVAASIATLVVMSLLWPATRGRSPGERLPERTRDPVAPAAG